MTKFLTYDFFLSRLRCQTVRVVIAAVVVEAAVEVGAEIAAQIDTTIVAEVLRVTTGEDVAIDQEVEAETGGEDLPQGNVP